MTGALTQQAASFFWALVYERLFAVRRRRPGVPRLAAEATAMSVIALAVDYTTTPKRLTPGYELRLSKKSILGAYLAFAAGLALAGLTLPARER